MEVLKLLKRIEKLSDCHLLDYVGDEKERFPFYKLTKGQGKKVLLTSVLHGDEPSGAYSILDFFEKDIKNYDKEFEFTAFPLVNPYGLYYLKRQNAQGIDINRSFHHNSKCKESKLIKNHLEKYVFTMDFHETGEDPSRKGFIPKREENPDEFYLCEYNRNKKQRVGKKIIENIEQAGISVCKWPKIYLDTNDNGVIFYPENNGTLELASELVLDWYLEKYHTSHSFTIEASDKDPLEKRVEANLIALKTVLDSKR